MPETLTKSEVDSKTDPSVSKQYDNETPKEQQIKNFYEIADKLKVGILNTYRKDVGTSIHLPNPQPAPPPSPTSHISNTTNFNFLLQAQ